MKISQKLEEALNLQVNYEFTAAYEYLALAASLNATAFTGFATWMTAQAHEECEHAMKIYNYMYLRGSEVTLFPLPKPAGNIKEPIKAFQKALELEKETTKNIHALYQLAVDEKDFSAQEFLNYFVKEQDEEEDSIQSIIDQLTFAGERSAAVLQLDSIAGKRTS